MKICPYCKTQNPDQARFCMGCGSRIPEQNTEIENRSRSASNGSWETDTNEMTRIVEDQRTSESPVYAQGNRLSSNHSHPSPHRRQKKKTGLWIAAAVLVIFVVVGISMLLAGRILRQKSDSSQTVAGKNADSSLPTLNSLEASSESSVPGKPTDMEKGLQIGSVDEFRKNSPNYYDNDYSNDYSKDYDKEFGRSFRGFSIRSVYRCVMEMNMYAEPSTDSEAIKTLDVGETVTVVENYRLRNTTETWGITEDGGWVLLSDGEVEYCEYIGSDY